MSLALVTNVVTLVGFSVAMVEALSIPIRPGGRVTRGIRLMLAALMAIFVFVSLSHVLQYAGVTTTLDVYENYLKVMFFPLAACAMYAVRINDQLLETQRHALILSAEHDMLMRIVDTTPTALLVLDGSGRIEFSNEKAKQILELEDNPDTGTPRTPSWVCSCDPSGEPGVLVACLGEGAVRDEVATIVWPDGRSVTLLMNATPIVGANGGNVGGVVAFTAVEPAVSA